VLSNTTPHQLGGPHVGGPGPHQVSGPSPHLGGPVVAAGTFQSPNVMAASSSAALHLSSVSANQLPPSPATSSLLQSSTVLQLMPVASSPNDTASQPPAVLSPGELYVPTFQVSK